MSISVIIPVYNERETILEILKKVQEVDLDKEIIVVDDGSTDGTWELLQKISWELTLLRHDTNRGKGAAIRTALPHVHNNIVIIQDADLEYDPRDYPNLVSPIVEGEADVVYGSRFLGGPHRVLFFWHSIGNQLLTLFSNMLTDLSLTDMECGYKVFQAEVIKGLRVKSNRFGFEPEVTAKISKLDLRIYEVPISYHGRTYQEGKKITWKDGLIALYCIVRFRFFD